MQNHNEEVTYQYAGFWKRAGAQLIDLAIFLIAWGVIESVLTPVLGKIDDELVNREILFTHTLLDIIEYLVTDLFTKYPNCRLYRTKHTYSFSIRELAGVTNNPFRTVPMANTDHSLFIEVYKSDTHKLNFYAYADNTNICESISHIFYGSYIDDTATNTYDPAKFSGWKAIDGVKLYQPTEHH